MPYFAAIEMDAVNEEILRELIDSKGALELFDMIHESSSSSESSEDEDEDDLAMKFMLKIDNYSERDFKSQFRLNRSTVDYIVSAYSKSGYSTSSTRHGGRARMGFKKEVLIFLFYLGNTVTFNELGELFGVPKSSAWFAVGRVSGWLVATGDKYVKWPQGEQVKENATRFGSINRIPGVLGAINCTGIKTNCTTRNKHFPKKRKKIIHIVLQVVVDAEKKFIDIDMCCGDALPGILHDSRILKKTILYKKAQANYKGLFPYNTFLIGNSAYLNSNWLITPFNEEMTESHTKFNKLHSSTHKTATDTLALLKSRFRRSTQFTEQRWIKGVMNIVASACILHNISIIMNDTFEIEEVEEASRGSENASEELPKNLEIDKRQLLFDYMCQRKII